MHCKTCKIVDNKGYFVQGAETKPQFSKKPLTKPKPKKLQVDKMGKPVGIVFG